MKALFMSGGEYSDKWKKLLVLSDSVELLESYRDKNEANRVAWHEKQRALVPFRQKLAEIKKEFPKFSEEPPPRKLPPPEKEPKAKEEQAERSRLKQILKDEQRAYCERGYAYDHKVHEQACEIFAGLYPDIPLAEVTESYSHRELPEVSYEITDDIPVLV